MHGGPLVVVYVYVGSVVVTCAHKGARCKRHHKTIQPESVNGFDIRYI